MRKHPQPRFSAPLAVPVEEIEVPNPELKDADPVLDRDHGGLGLLLRVDPLPAARAVSDGVLVYGELGTLVHTEAGLTGTSWTYLEADEIAESGLGRLNNHLLVNIRTWGASHTHVAIREIEWEFDRV